MVNFVPKKGRDGPPRSRLEGWLERKIQAGSLKRLPRYFPPRGRSGECPDEYARMILEGLQGSPGNSRSLERIKDDGRAFRSWTELVRPVGPQGGLGRGLNLAHAFAG